MSLSYAPPQSQWVDLDGAVHYVDHGGPADGPLLVCVHGLGGSLVNWAAIAPLLTPTARVIALDLPGFGRTRGVGRSTTVVANQRVLHRFLNEVVGGPAILVGNSMGGLITILEASSNPSGVAGAVLVDPALPVPFGARIDPMVAATFSLYAVPPLGRAALAARRRKGPEQAAMEVLKLCTVDVTRVPRVVIEQHMELARERVHFPEGPDALLSAARSLMRVLARRRRFMAMLDRIEGPVLLLQGDRDRLVPLASAKAVAKAQPTWRFEVARDVGHIPQLEVAEWTAAQILDWLGTGAVAAAEHTRHTSVLSSQTDHDSGARPHGQPTHTHDSRRDA